MLFRILCSSLLILSCAQAQALVTSQISINVTGSGTGDEVSGFNLSGTGTLAPFGNVTVTITSTPAVTATIPLTVTFTFSDGDTLSATSMGQKGTDSVSGTASISGGTGQFKAATGSFQYGTVAPAGTTSANVQFTFTGSGSVTAAPAAGSVRVSPGALSFSANAGGGSPGSQTVTLLSAGTTQTAFTVTLDGGQANTPAPSWLTVAPLAGTTPGVLTVSVNPAGLDAGTFNGRILVNATNSTAPMAIAVSLTVTAAPAKLSVSPEFLRYSAGLANGGVLDQSIVVANAGGSGALSFSVSVPNPIPWLESITPGNGQASPNSPAIVDVRINTNGLGVGGYKGTIQVSSGSSSIDVPISLFISSAGPTLSVDQTGLRFVAQLGQAGSQSNTIQVLNNGAPGSTVNFTTSVVNSVNWLTVSPATGTATASQPGVLTVSTNSHAQTLGAGAYYAVVQITDPKSNNSPQYVVVVLNVVNTNVPVAPDPMPQGLVFTAAGTQPITLAVSGPLVTFSASGVTTDGGTWLSVSPGSGSVSSASPATVTVSVNPAGLKAGIYTGLVNTATGAQVRGVNVTLIVPAGAGAAAALEAAAAASSCIPARVVLTQTGLTNNFAVPAGWPASLEIAMFDDCANSLSSGSVVASFTNGDPPLSLNSDTHGVFSATWQPGNATANTTVSVRGSSGTLQPGSAQITGVVTPNAAPVLYSNGTVNNYYGAAALSPGLIAQVYGSGLASGVGQPDSLPLPGEFQGTSVMIGSQLAPLYYVSSGQINVQIPTELTPGQERILVSVNGAFSLPDLLDINPLQPGVAAYTDGSNNVIAQHADFSYVTSDHPAKPSEVVIIYLAGMGATNPAVPSGQGAPTMEPLARVVNMPTVTVDGQNAAVSFAGLAPGFVGLYQVDLQVPANARSGSLALVVSQNGVAGNTTNLIVGQ
jgi:uncharacterized protein (TIGR03437 family)